MGYDETYDRVPLLNSWGNSRSNNLCIYGFCIICGRIKIELLLLFSHIKSMQHSQGRVGRRHKVEDNYQDKPQYRPPNKVLRDHGTQVTWNGCRSSSSPV